MKRLVAKGLSLDFVQRELLDEVTIGLKDGYINLEVLDKEVICSAFAALIARRLRFVLGEERGKEYAKSVQQVLESIILHPLVTGELSTRVGSQLATNRQPSDHLLENNGLLLGVVQCVVGVLRVYP